MSRITYTCGLCGQVQAEYRQGGRVHTFTDAELRARDERIIRAAYWRYLYANTGATWPFFNDPDFRIEAREYLTYKNRHPRATRRGRHRQAATVHTGPDRDIPAAT